MNGWQTVALTIAAALAIPATALGAGRAPEVDLARAEEISTGRCSLCHGPNGESSSSLYPRLAGQHHQYIAKQLADFQSGRRQSDTMNGMAQDLTVTTTLGDVAGTASEYVDGVAVFRGIRYAADAGGANRFLPPKPAPAIEGVYQANAYGNSCYGLPYAPILMEEEGVERWVLAGTDYVYPQTTNKILEQYLKDKGVAAEDIMINYTPFGHSDWQTIVSDIKTFGSTGKKTAVVSTINGDANVPFYKELANQGIKAEDIPVVAFSVGEEELAGFDTSPLVGHLAAWNYFQSVDTPENADMPELLVYCGAGMREPMDEIASVFTERTGIPINFVFGGSNTLLTQITGRRQGFIHLL